MSDEKLTLDDIAALIIQIEPTDSEDLARVRRGLNSIADSAPALVQRPIAEAVKKIDQMTEGDASDPFGLLADIGAFIEQAMNVMEKSGGEETPFTDSESEQVPIVGAAPEAGVSNALPPEADPSLLEEFITESRDLIAGAEAALLELETDPENTEALNVVFRAFHTVKGTSAFLGLSHISELAHKAESFFSRIRDKEIRCDGGYADLAFRSVDMLKDLIKISQDALGGKPMTAPDGLSDLMALLAEPEAVDTPGYIHDGAVGVEEMPPRLGDFPVARGEVDPEETEKAVAEQGDQPVGRATVRSKVASVKEVSRAPQKQRGMSGSEPVTESSVRVRTDRLDRLIEMVGELVIGHSMVTQDETVNSGTYPELQHKVNHTGKIVRQMQELCMSIRMVPFKATVHKIARLVRDLARRRKITINFIPVGEDTEIDRNMVDLINDPLVHLIRNAVDHGIEPPDVREKHGKPRVGTLWLKAYHSGGNVVVEISDDGRGLDREKIIGKAIAKGLIQSDQSMSDSEIINLIFQPGFSTADTVTDISGRGVGLDVVRQAVETLRGRVDVSSEFGKGCTFSIRLPLTMAITDGMLVRVGHQRYILPTINIDMSFRPDSAALSTIAGRAETVVFNGKVIPIFRLHRLFDIKEAVEDPTNGLLIIIGDGNQRCALLVDELVGQQQVVAKSLGDGIGKVQGISGGAILGDGRVGLILDPQGIAALARQASDPGTRGRWYIN
ncbi:MAG TPA: chemotaxis protein CheA [Thermodesulfobacteriota bacterium]|nr:chemotaxis protein CheA [Thermodesulfobacteriota bacterium]